MKKIYTFAVIGLFCFVNANAQFTKGQKLLGGSLGFSVNDVTQKPAQTYDYKNNSVSIVPSVGWFVSTNQIVGFTAKFERSDHEQISLMYSSQETISKAAGAGIFTQRFFPIVNRLYFNLKGSGGVDYLFGKAVSTYNGSSTENNNHGLMVKVALAPGMSYQVNRHFLFDLSLNDLAYASYNRTVTKYINAPANGKVIDRTFQLASSLSSTLSNVGLGFRWLIK